MAVGKVPSKIGFDGSVISTNAAFVVVHTKAYSFPVSGSVQPQESLPSEPCDFIS